MRAIILAAIIAECCCHAASGQTMNQFWLAAQHDWGMKKGFFLSLNGSSNGAAATLENLRLELGVGDGSNWRILSRPTRWEYGRAYTARAVIGETSAELWLDDQLLAREDVRFSPASHPLASNEQPAFLRGPARYTVRQEKLLAKGGGEPFSITFENASIPPQLLLFNPAVGARREAFDPGTHLSLDATFTLAEAPDLKSLAPFIDTFGQSIHADWPGKVRQESDLLAARDQEQRRLAEWDQPGQRDPYGGAIDAPWKVKPTGFFHVVQRDGTWWLITPDGNPCFYVGLCDAPALDWEATPIDGREFLFQGLPDRQGDFARAWIDNPWHRPEERGGRYVAHHTANLVRKYGADWEKRAITSTLERVRTLGFSGLGKWVSPGTRGVAQAAVLYHGEIPNLVRHPDVFDEQIRERWTQLLRAQIEPRRDDPWLIGWSVGNEFDENIAAADVVQILAMPSSVPAKRAMLEHAQTALYGGDEARLRAAWKVGGDVADLQTAVLTAPPGDVESLRRFYADRYYRFIYQAVKAIDPHHLYLGMWVTPNWWENEADWDLIAPHCDVIGYDFYARAFDAEPMKTLIARNDKPVLCGEFAVPPDYAGRRGYGRYHVSCESEAEAGRYYAKWLAAASADPRCVGVFYFQYRDQPLTGRGPMTSLDSLVIGENFAFGLVDVTDRLKWEFVEQVRAANLSATASRLRQSPTSRHLGTDRTAERVRRAHANFRGVD